MSPELENRIARLAANRESGASEILDEAIAILREALDRRADVVEVARAVRRAQPTMGPIWNAAVAAIAAIDRPERFTRFAERVARAGEAVERFATECLVLGREPAGRAHESTPLRLVTISHSRTVLRVFEALNRLRRVHVTCSEGRPGFEGRTLARRLAALDVPVTLFTDAALGHAMSGADAVVVGADAIGPDVFLNKSGTRMLAAAAMQQGVPFYVVASRDKFVSRDIAARLDIRDGAAAEVWDDAPTGVTVRNPYFDATPVDLVTAVITDTGVLESGAVPDVCDAVAREASPAALTLLLSN